MTLGLSRRCFRAAAAAEAAAATARQARPEAAAAVEERRGGEQPPHLPQLPVLAVRQPDQLAAQQEAAAAQGVAPHLHREDRHVSAAQPVQAHGLHWTGA